MSNSFSFPTVSSRRLLVLVCALHVVSSAAPAMAQLNYNAEANYGTHTLSAGFMPDPMEISTISGGSVNLASAVNAPGCAGYATSNPDVKLVWQSSSAGLLRLWVESPGDTTLVINDAQGNWHCDDDSGGNQNPEIDLRAAASGRYDIWIGSYSADDNFTAILHISELTSTGPGGGGGGSQSLDYSAAANYGTHTLSAGFMPDPLEIRTTSGGNVNLAAAINAPGCAGYATSNPDVKLVWQASSTGFLRLWVESPGDTTLVINDSQGNWHCDDDSGGGTNPRIDLNAAASGRYDIWIGSYSAADNFTAILKISEFR